MGHLVIVNAATYEETIASGFIGVRASLGANGAPTKHSILGQYADLAADLLGVRAGDLIFPWITDTSRGVAFRNASVARGRAYRLPGVIMPLRVDLKDVSRNFAGLTEADALDLWEHRLLWNAIGKKSLGRPRTLTHQTPYEDSELLRRLLATGEAPDRSATHTPHTLAVDPIEIVTAQIDAADASLHWHELLRTDPATRLGAVDPNRVCWTSKGQFIYEKALEAWIMANWDRPAGRSLIEALAGGDFVIEWAGNYLPFGVAGANIDMMVWGVGPNGDRTVFVIELKKAVQRAGGAVGADNFQTTKSQVLTYVRYIRAFIDRWRPERPPIVVPVIISGANAARTTLPIPDPDVSHLVYTVLGDGRVEFACA